MFQPHTDFTQIEDNAILWRYQDLPRYLDLLLKQQLFFCRADKFEDPFEGQYVLQNKEELIKETIANINGNNARKVAAHEIEQKLDRIVEEHTTERTFVTINSWHCNTEENYAMWRIYAKGTYGIAIQTTYERLKKCFDATDKNILIGKVDYYDANCKALPLQSPLLPFLRKRSIYQYENEVRCCYVIPHEEKTFNWQEQDTDDGIFVNIDINTLIERIFISPYSPKWIRDIVAGINEKCKLDKEIVHSTVFDASEY